MRRWRDDPGALPLKSSHYRFFDYLLVELDLRAATLAEAIVVHRFHSGRLVLFKTERAAIVDPRPNTNASNRLLGRQTHSFRGLCQTSIAKALERRARRRLLNVTARSAGEARQKVLYVMAAVVAGRLRLEANDIKRIVATIGCFGVEVEDLLILRHLVRGFRG